MFVNCLRNFFKSLKFYFLPLGITTFIMIITISISLSVSINAVKGAFDTIAAKLGSTTYDWPGALQVITGDISSLDWSQGASTLVTVFSDKDWMISTLKDASATLFGQPGIETEMVAILQQAVGTIFSCLAVCFAFFIISGVVGLFALMYVSRRAIAETSVIKTILFSIFDSVIGMGLLILIIFLHQVSLVAQIIALVISIFLLLFGSQLLAYIFYGIGKVSLKEVFSIKSALLLLLGNIVDLAFGIAIIIVPFFMLDPISSMLLVIPVAEITYLVITMNAEGHIHRLAKQKKLEAVTK